MIDYILSRFNSFSLDTHGLTPENLLSRSKKAFAYSPLSDTLIIALPGWGQSLLYWKNLKKWAVKSGFSFLSYEFPYEILSGDYILTKKNFSFINTTVRQDIGHLKNKHGFKRCVLIGISLSSSYGSMIYNHNLDISEIILACPGNNLAQNMWSGCRTQHLRKSYQKQGVGLPKLKEYWHELASENNMPALNTKTTILYGKYDTVIRYNEAKVLGDIFEENSLRVTIRNYRCGHYILLLYFLLFPGKILKKLFAEEA